MRSLLFASTALLTTSIASSAMAEGVVNVYNWSDYIDEEILKEFTAETGIKVVYDVFDSNEILETKLLAGKTGYDIVVPSAEFLGRQVKAGVFQKLDKGQLPNIANMWDMVEARTAPYDPNNAYSINYMWGTTGIGYNVGKVKEILGQETVDSWDVIFDPEISAKFKDCGIHVLDAPVELVRAALRYKGLNPDSRDQADLDVAEALLASVRGNIRKFHSSEYINALANGDICLAVGWSGDIFQARDRAAEAEAGVDVGYSIPKEGAMMWFDQMAIPATADNVKEAHIFLDYIMRPDVIAKSTNYVYYANGNKASQPLLEEDLIGDPAIYPPAEVMENLYTVLPYDPRTNRVVTRMWTKVKTGQ